MTLSRVVKAFLLFILIFIAGLFYFYNRSADSDSFNLEYPLPKIFSEKINQVLATHDYWKPKNQRVKKSNTEKPEFTARAILSYDLSSDQILYEKNSKEKLPIASLTKIMTAVVIIENEDLNELVTVSRRAAEIGENSMMLKEGEKLTRKELLFGLILPSGNDAAEVLAETSTVGRDNFVYLMNKKAEDLGLTDTYYTNPSGLEGDGNQYSTAHDLLVITRYAMNNPTFAEIVATVEKELPANSNHGRYKLINDTNLLTTYPGVKGVKTGFTYEAGMCLISYLEHDGKRIIAILLNSQNRRQEMKDLLDYSLTVLGSTPPEHN